MRRVINNHTQPVTLTSGVVLAAAGAEGSTALVESLDDRDRKKAGKGLIAIVEDAAPVVPVPPAEVDATNTDKRRGK
jgi:hypothetical protein